MPDAADDRNAAAVVHLCALVGAVALARASDPARARVVLGAARAALL